VRIAQVATLASPVRRCGAHSIEGLVWLLARELTRLGHEVTTFATAGSQVDGELVVTLPGPYARDGAPGDWQLCEWLNICSAVSEAGKFDILHSHNYLWAMPLSRLCLCPIVHTLHVSPYDDAAFLWSRHPDAWVTAISKSQWSRFPQLTPAAVIPHAVDEEQFSFRAQPDDYLLYLGRFTSGKGPLTAIKVARQMGMRLLLAGPRNDYFAKVIEPHVDGHLIQYIGPVEGAQRDRVLGGAKVLLYPVQSPEPFGLVLIEAMMCGTPVAARAIGAVREVVEDGITGCHCVGRGIREFVHAVERAAKLDRSTVRGGAAARYSSASMADQYVAVYERLMSMTACSISPSPSRGVA
jgi:glycosyltransferase involved in cell wall biosynthesis